MRTLNLLYEAEWWSALYGLDGKLLGSDPNLWNPVENHPGFAATERWLREQETPDEEIDEGVRSLLTHSLLLDVVHAACGIERAVRLVELHSNEAQTWVNDLLRARFKREQVGSMHRSGEVISVSHALCDVVLWTRLLMDRVRRKDRLEHQEYAVGLLPQLADDEVRRSVERAFGKLEARLGRIRDLANYVAHHSGIPGPAPHGEIDDNWGLHLYVPKAPQRDTYAPEMLDFHDAPTARQYAENVLAAVAEFMTKTLYAFREAAERRSARISDMSE